MVKKTKTVKKLSAYEERLLNEIKNNETNEKGEVTSFSVDNGFDTYYGDVKDLILDY